MAYYFYIDKMLCPVPPQKLQLKIKNNNKTLILMDEGEVNILKKAGLTEISFDLLLPNVKYPFAKYESGFKRAKYYLKRIEKLKTNQNPFQFIVTRTLPNGKWLFSTNIKVSMEDYQLKEDYREGFDVEVAIKLKQYVDYGTKVCTIQSIGEKIKVSKKKSRPKTNSPDTNKKYKVVKGDCLWTLAKKFYGDGSKYHVIYDANKDKVKNPNLIYPGQILIIPDI